MFKTSYRPLRRVCLAILSFVFLLLLAPMTYAQNADAQEESSKDAQTEVVDLGTIYVEETLLAEEEVLDRPTAFATVLDPQALSRTSTTLSEALDSVPGVSVRSFGGLGALSTVSIRGAGSESVMVLLDGVPLNPTGGAVDLADIPLDSLERIEIIRGGEGAYYGPGAVGGVVRLTSRAPGQQENARYSGRFSVGSFRTAAGGFTWKAPDWLVHVEGAGSRGEFPFLNDNGTAFDASDDFIDVRENNEYTSAETRVGHNWRLSRDRTVALSAEWYRGEKGIPGMTTFPSPHASQTDQRRFLQGIYTDPSAGRGELALSVAWLWQSRRYSDPFGESTGVPLETSRTHTRLETKAEWVGAGLGEDDVLTLGASWVSEELRAAEYGDPHRSLVAAWLRDEWYASEDFVVVGGARLDSIDGEGTFSPKIGARFDVTEGLTVRSNLGLDFRPPSFEELYRNEGLVVGNPELEPERTLSFDVGLTHTTDRLRLQASYFNLQTRDLIDYLLISGFRWKPYNIGRARSSGFELSAHWVIAPGWELRANHTRTHAIDTSGDPLRQGRPLVGQPSSETFCELRWRQDGWQAFLNWQHQGSSPITPSGTRSLPACQFASVGLGYEFSDGVTLLLESKNIFDDALTDVRGFPLPGRSWFLTMTGEW